MRELRGQCVPRRAARSPANRFSSVRGHKELLVSARRARRFARASAAPCIRRARLQAGRVPLVSAPAGRLRDQFVLELVPAHLRAGPASATCRAA